LYGEQVIEELDSEKHKEIDNAAIELIIKQCSGR